MLEDFTKYDPFFENDLKNCKIAQLSLTPDVPGKDELINHQIIGHQLLDTKSGKLLLIELKNMETSEKYTYSYPDIQEIKLNSSSNAEFQKYYLTCLDRKKAFEIQELQDFLSKGISISEEEKEFLRENDGHVEYRIMLMGKKN